MKRANGSQQPKHKLHNKNKNKSKNKSKDKKFNPLEYLNALIEQIHQHRIDTTRKKTITAKRELSSALAYATPLTDHTIASSKVRSKSSYSQYRKKSVPMKEVLRIDVGNIITEEDDVIHFTQTSTVITPHSNDIHFQLPYPTIRSRAAAARKIQRAWRNYMTLKVVKKYFEYYKNIMRKDTELREAQFKLTQQKMDFCEGKKSMQRTLKIRKTRDEAIYSNKTARVISISEVARNLQISSELDTQANLTKELMRQTSDIGVPNETLTIQLTSNAKDKNVSQEYTSKDLQLVIELFRHSHDQAQKQIHQHIDKLCKVQSQIFPLNSISSQSSSELVSPHRLNDSKQISNQAFSPSLFMDMERTIRQKYTLMKQKIQKKFEDHLIELKQLQRQTEQLNGLMKRQLNEIDKFKQHYQNNMEQLKKNVLKLNINSSTVETLSRKMGRSVHERVRKCYSADTLILKSIVEDVGLKLFDLEFHNVRTEPPILPEYSIEQSINRQEGTKQQEGSIMFPTSPPSCSPVEDSGRSFNCYEYNTGDKLRQQIYNNSNYSNQIYQQKIDRDNINEFNDSNDSLVEMPALDQEQVQYSPTKESQKESDNLGVIQECSEQLQELIQHFLVQEIVQQIYLNPKMFSGFKVCLEHPYAFKTINDWDIASFLYKQLPVFYQAYPLLQKFNQKLNPTSLQILRLIRDLDFQIDEYELILPQEVFKAYRSQLQQQYAVEIKKYQASQLNQEEISLRANVVAKIRQRWVEGKLKKIKLMSFERDLKIMYMKSVFNCYNQFIIQTKSFYTFMNARSSIGPGELSLAIKQYNCTSPQQQYQKIMQEAKQRVMAVVRGKCILPIFKNYKDLESFQRQINQQLVAQMTETQFKWVNFMDEVLQIWHQLSLYLIQTLIDEATLQFAHLL